MITGQNKQITLLQQSILHLNGLGIGDTSLYPEEFTRSIDEVSRLTNDLYHSVLQSDTPEREATICLALLQGYQASYVDYGDKQQHINNLLSRCWNILDRLPATPLKLHLLATCYIECADESLLDEAVKIIRCWKIDGLTETQRKAIATYNFFK